MILLEDDNVIKVSGFVDFLEGIFEECNKARIDKNVRAWYDLLVVATLNLSTEMNVDDMDYFKGLKKSLASKVELVGKGLEVEDFYLVPVELEESLFDWEIALRKIRRDANLQHSLKNDKRRFT